MRFLFIFSHSPYGGGLAREALDMALATAAFDQEVSLVFSGAGIFQLLATQQAPGVNKKSQLGAINALPLYDISRVFYLQEDLSPLGVNAGQLVAHARPLDAEALRSLVNGAERVQSF